MNNKEIWIVMDKQGFGWSIKIGKKVTPDLFASMALADDHAREIRAKWNVEVIPAPIRIEDLIKLAGL